MTDFISGLSGSSFIDSASAPYQWAVGIVALQETIRLMAEIDAAIEA